jgi:hypothetical protein
MGLKDDCLIPVWDRFRALVNLKYLISGIIAALIFVSMLSAAPTPWWIEVRFPPACLPPRSRRQTFSSEATYVSFFWSSTSNKNRFLRV